MSKISIVIADDHTIFREGLKIIIEKLIPNAKVISFSNGKDVLDYIEVNKSVDVVILDVDMQPKNGIETSTELTRIAPSIPVVMMTLHKDELMQSLCFSAGAKGYLTKDNAIDELLICIENVRKNQTYITHLIDKSKPQDLTILERLKSLTSTEEKVLACILRNKGSKEIANELFITSKSVDNYRSRICRKLELSQKQNSLSNWVIEHKNILEKMYQSNNH